MKPATKKKIEAAIASGRQFDSMTHLAKECGMILSTVSDYARIYGIPQGVIITRAKRTHDALLKAANEGACTIKQASQMAGINQRTADSALKNAHEIRAKLEVNRVQQRRDMLTRIISDFDELQHIGYTAPEAAKKLDMNKNRYYAACYDLGVKIYTQRPENQPEPPQRVSRPSGLYNKLLTGRISASA